MHPDSTRVVAEYHEDLFFTRSEEFNTDLLVMQIAAPHSTAWLQLWIIQGVVGL